MTDKEKSIILENLAILYLRLNGYFTTGFIIHSKEKKIETELDIVAVRFSLHKQDDTGHNSSDFLELGPESNTIDIIIGEVKSIGVELQFNKCLREQQNYEPIEKLLRWIGLCTDQQVTDLAKEVSSLLQTQPNSKLKAFLSTKPTDTKFGKVVIRPILFCPERVNINNTNKFVSWTEINNFIWTCLCPEKDGDLCGTRYDFTAWGQGLTEIVRVYKDRQKMQVKYTKIDELYQEIELRKKAGKPI